MSDDSSNFLPQLGAELKKLVYGHQDTRKALQDEYGVTITRSDFYSEIPTITDIISARSSSLDLTSIFPSGETMKRVLNDLVGFSSEFSPPQESESDNEYSWDKNSFSFSDAMAYYAFIRAYKPKQIIEVGSGASTLVAKKACAQNGYGKITCIEPFPSEALCSLGGVELIRKRVQDLPTTFFNDNIGDGDILFIDSTHTVKHNSDCLHLYLNAIPSITSSVLIHAHDIFLPKPLPDGHMIEHQVYWNEQYLLYAYLLMNHRTEVLYGSNWHFINNKSGLDDFMHGRCQSGGASFWFRQLPCQQKS